MAIRQTEGVVFSQAWVDTQLLDQLGAATPTVSTLIGGHVGLFVGELVPTPQTVLADFTPADFTGYANFSIADTTTTGTSPTQRGVFIDALFTQTGTTVTNTVTGWMIVTSDLELCCSGRFSSPVVFNAAGNLLDLATFLPISMYQTVPDQS